MSLIRRSRPVLDVVQEHIIEALPHSSRYDERMLSLEICLPVLNEAQTIEEQMTFLLNQIQPDGSLPPQTQFVIADNGSTDMTLEIANRLAANNQSIRVVSTGERGVGKALRTAWESSTCQVVGYMDLDLATDLKHVNEALFLIENKHDFVNGSRWLKGSQVSGRSLMRGFVSWTFNKIVRSYLHTSVTDGMCGFKFLSREILPDLLLAGAQSNRWFFSTEIAVVAASRKVIDFVEIPVCWTNDSSSKVKVLPLTMEYLNEMRKFRRRLDV